MVTRIADLGVARSPELLRRSAALTQLAATAPVLATEVGS